MIRSFLNPADDLCEYASNTNSREQAWKERQEERSLQLMLGVGNRPALLSPSSMTTEDSRESDEGGEDGSEERNPYGKVI